MIASIEKPIETTCKQKTPDIADILRDTLPHLRKLSDKEQQVVNNILNCRTAALGGHMYICNQCSHAHQAYNSCRDRHCPKCGSIAKYKWLEARKKEILNTQYFHLVFTLPACLYDLILYNKEIGYRLMFKAVSETILEASLNTENIGAKAGLLAILHTWSQKLLFHPHLHVIIPGGGLSDDHTEWISAAKNYFISHRKLSLIYRGKMISQIKKAYKNNQWDISRRLKHLQDKNIFESLISKSCKHKWVVYAKPTFANAERVYDYLGRYTHRVAISNDRIKEYKNGVVSFTYKDRKDSGKVKLCKLSHVDFIHRFLLHVLPKNFYKIRYYGFMANTVRKERLEQCREALGMEIDLNAAEEVVADFITIMKEIDNDFLKCPKCKRGVMVALGKIVSGEDSS